MNVQAINITGSSSGFQAAANSTVTAMNNVNNECKEWIKQSVEFNAKGRMVRQTIQSMVGDLVKYTEVTNFLANGQTRVVRSFDATSEAMKKQAQAARDLAKATREAADANTRSVRGANLQYGTEQLSSAFPVPSSASLTQLAAYQGQMQKILSMLSTGKLTAGQFNEVLGRVRSGDLLNLKDFTKDQQAAFIAMQKLGQSFKDVRTESQKYGLTLKNIFNIGEALLFKQILASITNELVTSVGAAVKLQIAIAQIRTISQETQSTTQQWQESLMRISGATGLDIEDVSAAAYDTLSNQITQGAAETERFLTTAGDFARVTLSTTKDSVNLLSSAMTAFKIPVEDAEKVAATFFKTIDLGRIKAADLSNTFGRVAQPAAAMGLTLEETAAALTTLTRQGVSASDAQTQLLNLMTRLLKPAGDLKDLMASWGTPTIEAANATFGFAEVLRRLGEAAKGSSTELANLFPDIRGFRGAGGLTSGTQFQQFSSDLEKIKQASREYDIAKELRAEPAADKIIKEFNRVKNFFIQEFGVGIINLVSKINDALQSISSTLGFSSMAEAGKSLLSVIGSLGKAFLLYKGSIIAMNLAVGALNLVTRAYLATKALVVPQTIAATAATNANTAAVVANQVAQTGAGASTIKWTAGLAAAVPVVGTMAAGLYLLYEATKQNAKGSEEFAAALQDLEAQAAKTRKIKEATDSEKRTTKFKENEETLFGPIFKRQAEDIKLSTNALEDLREAGKDVATDLENSFKTYTDSIGAGIKVYKDNILDAKRAIESGEKAITRFGDTVDRILLEVGEQYANDNQKILLYQQEIQKLQTEASRLFATGKNEDYREAERLVTTIFGIQRKMFDLETQRGLRSRENLNNQRLAGMTAAERRLEQNIDMDPSSKNFGKSTVILDVDRSPLQQAGEMWKKYLKEGTIISAEAARKISDESKIAEEKEKARLHYINQFYKQARAIDPYTKEGTYKDEFQVGGGDKRPDPAKIKAAQDKVLAELGKVTVPDAEKEQYTKFYADLEASFTQIHKIGLAERQKADLEDAQQTAIRLRESRVAAEAAVKKASESTTNTIIEQGGVIDQILARAKNLMSISEETRLKRSNQYGIVGKQFQSEETSRARDLSNAAYQSTEMLNKQLEELANRAKDLAKSGGGADELNQIFATMENVFSALYGNLVQMQEAQRQERIGKRISAGEITKEQGRQEIEQGRITGGIEQTIIPGSTSRETIGDVREKAKASIDQIKKLLQEEADAKQKYIELEASQKGAEALVEYTRSVTNAGLMADFAAGKLGGGGLAGTVMSVDAAFKNLEGTINAIMPARQNIPNMTTGEGVFNSEGSAGSFAGGGLIGGGPPGIDTVPAWLDNGEYVMPANKTRQFLPLLRAMHYGSIVAYGAGSNVSTTVGDVNITVQGNASPDKTIRQIGEGLRREILRGNIKLTK